MGRGISFCPSFQPDFGLPYPRGWEADFNQLNDDELVALAGFKAAIQSGHKVDIQSLPARLRLQATKIYSEHNAREDPMQFGWTLEGWRDVLAEWKNYPTHFIFGGNRSSKSVFMSRLVVWALMNIPECRIRCYQVNDEKSIAEQQAYIWDALPEKYKTIGKKRGQAHTINYTQANGFTGGKLILPPLPGCDRGGECIFGTYQQYRNDPQIVESYWAHLIWCDEEVELKMFERLLYRIKDANGRLFVTFTTIKGWTPLVEDIIGKAKTLKKRHSYLLKRELPVAQESTKRKGVRIHYFWTQDNPFLPHGIMDSFEGRPVDEIKATAHGIPTKNAVATLSSFDEDVHVIPHEKIPFLQPDFEGHVTRYHIIDPAGDKPWFMIWAGVDALKRIFIYREFPDESYGEWGVAGSTPEGAKGPAQKNNDLGIQDYIDFAGDAEKNETIHERVMDSRLGNTKQHTKDGATTIISEVEDATASADPAKQWTIIPAPGLNIHHGLDLIKSALKWDTTKPLSITNAPKLYISDRCTNTIEAFKNYSNYNATEVWKDPVDCVRYLLENGAEYVGPEMTYNTSRTFSYGS